MIIFVDDELRRVESYTESCEDAGLAVQALSRVDEAWSFIEKNAQQIKMVILDVMMPTGDRYDESAATLGGIRTGLSFYRDLRSHYPTLQILVLTQSNDREVDTTIAGDDRTILLRKQSVLPTELPDLIRKRLEVGGKG